MSPILDQALQDVSDRLGHLAIDIVQDEFRITQDGVERGAQFVAHVSKELGLVPAGGLKLAPLLLDLAEEPGVLDSEHGLAREGSHEGDDLWGELSRGLPSGGQTPDDVILPQQRKAKESLESRSRQEASEKGRV